MRYHGLFVKEIRKENDKIVFSFHSMPNHKDGRIVLVHNEDEFIFPKECLSWSKDALILEMTPFLSSGYVEMCKWEVYMQVGEERYRFEEKKNRGRKRYQEGKKVKPYQEKKGVYKATQRVGDYYDMGEDLAVVPRYSRDWQLMFQVTPRQEAYVNRFFLKMDDLYLAEQHLHLKLGKESFGFHIKHINMTLRGGKKEYRLESIACNEYALNLGDILWEPFFWDFTVIAEKDGRVYQLKLRNYKKGFHGRVREKIGDFYLFSSYTQNDNIILHYRPYSEYDDEMYRRRERKAVLIYRLLKPYWDSRRIVLMYEKFCKCAQDNAFYMFEYYMEKKGANRRRTYYLIDSREPDAARLRMYGKHVVEFMSLRHMIYLQAASLLVATDTIKHAYQWRCENSAIYEKLLKKHSVFLQHGVLALKRVEYIYNKNGGNKTDLFISSSPMEQKIITDNFRYSKAEVPVTGLARWDVLTNKNKENVIMVMPTWRNWIIEVSAEEFRESDYYKNYMALLNSKELATMLEQYKTRLIYCMHPKFREFIGEFDTAGERIELFDYDQKPINEMVMEASMMVTDYSSVSWDMYYQEKPIVFYQFDYDRYMAEQGSYIDMTTQLYGDRAVTPEELISLLTEYMQSGFQEKKKYADLRQAYLPCRDGLHRKRIDEAIHKHAFTKLQAISHKILRS